MRLKMATQDRPSSGGAIKRSNAKISADGLTLLPPEPGLVKFESVGITRPCSSDCASVLGRVQRSLQVARKKELEEDTLCFESSVANGIGNYQIIEQDGGHDAQHTVGCDSTDIDLCNGVDKRQATSADNGVNANDTCIADLAQAPVELKGEFLKAVMDEEFGKAKQLCQKILLLEPDNKTCSEFHAVICEKMKQDDEVSDDSDQSNDETDETDESGDEEEEESENDDENNESSEEDRSDDDEEEEEEEEDDDVTLPLGPVNLIMGGLPIIPQKK